jgi:hypothetical protein
LGELIDDAGLFPPARLPMSEALAARERAFASDTFWIVGRFVVPASRLRELASELDDAPQALAATVILDAPGSLEEMLRELASDARALASRIALESIEFPLARIDAGTDDERFARLESALGAADFPKRPGLYVEIGLGEGGSERLGALHRARSRDFEVAAKIRCGGIEPSSIPDPASLAQFIWTANALRLPFKATAGLHHPLRHDDRSVGATVHGFLNVIGGAVLTRARGLDLRSLEQLILDCDAANFQLDEERFAWSGIGADAAEIGDARANFVRGYGSCSLVEPVDDLRALAMLPAGVV